MNHPGRLDYSTPGIASGRGHRHEYLPIHLDPALADATVTAAPPPPQPQPPSSAWQIPNYGGSSGTIVSAHPLHQAGGSRRASFDPVPMRASAAAAAAEEDKRRRNTVASARFRVKKKAREQALETREKDLSVRVGQLRKRIADLEVENRWLRELLLAKKDVGGATTDAHSRVLAQLETALKELRETVSDEDDDSGGGNKPGGSGDTPPGTSS